jgi:hypothetical protein
MKLNFFYHGQEDPKLRVHVHDVAIHEDEGLLLLLFAIQDQGDLLGGNGQNGQLDPVELVETAPRS